MRRATIDVELHLGAVRDELAGARDGVLNVELESLAADVRANRQLARLIAVELGVSPGGIAVSGHPDGSGRRRVRIDGLDQAAAEARLGLAAAPAPRTGPAHRAASITPARTGGRVVRRSPAGRRRRRLLPLAVLTVIAVAVLAVLAIGEGGSGPAARSVASTRTRAAQSPRTTPSASPPQKRHARRAHSSAPPPDPGKRPQTDQLPSADTAVFRAEMRGLFDAVRTDDYHRALPAFFPQAAYLQLKTIGDPAGDWRYRLVGDFRLDIGAAHALLGAGAARARLVGVEIPPGFAHWVSPGVCDNQVGYYEVPNARLLYSEAGQERSFGIASMISWRGVWYVVHLGAILRPVVTGQVDSPSSGPGVAAPSSTC